MVLKDQKLQYQKDGEYILANGSEYSEYHIAKIIGESETSMLVLLEMLVPSACIIARATNIQ
jgi:hypothetical protein